MRLVRLSLGQSSVDAPLQIGRFGVRTHSLMSVLMGGADAGWSRRRLAAIIGQAVVRRGLFHGSREDLTPIGRDPRSGIMLAMAIAVLLANPHNVHGMTNQTVADYALMPNAVRAIDGLADQEE